MRLALNDAAPLYRDAPEASGETRARACDLISTTLSSVGKNFSGSPRSHDEIAVYSDAMADMFCAYVTAINPALNEPKLKP